MYKKLQPYLKKRGLKSAEDKTKVTKLTDGFDFLGFTFTKRLKKDGTFKTVVTPSKESTKKARANIKSKFMEVRGNDVRVLIPQVMPSILGYSNHWKHVVSSEIFSKMDNYIFTLKGYIRQKAGNGLLKGTSNPTCTDKVKTNGY
ncbi:group II intron maturase-specific domain-containing protein [Bacillus mobilis]|uniref:group II intron maturase-specific domain-containing protein n=1 Tax=Bacillus mobilis TaxID=2026190 RepID=UPI0035E2DD11